MTVGLSRRTHNFVKVVANRIKTVAAFELFAGDVDGPSNKMSLDYQIPIMYEAGKEYELHLVCRIRYVTDDNKSTQTPIRVKGTFLVDQVLLGATTWVSEADVVGYPLVTALKKQVELMGKPTIIQLRKNDSVRPGMQRVMIE